MHSYEDDFAKLQHCIFHESFREINVSLQCKASENGLIIFSQSYRIVGALNCIISSRDQWIIPVLRCIQQRMNIINLANPCLSSEHSRFMKSSAFRLFMKNIFSEGRGFDMKHPCIISANFITFIFVCFANFRKYYFAIYLTPGDDRTKINFDKDLVYWYHTAIVFRILSELQYLIVRRTFSWFLVQWHSFLKWGFPSFSALMAKRQTIAPVSMSHPILRPRSRYQGCDSLAIHIE